MLGVFLKRISFSGLTNFITALEEAGTNAVVLFVSASEEGLTAFVTFCAVCPVVSPFGSNFALVSVVRGIILH